MKNNVKIKRENIKRKLKLLGVSMKYSINLNVRSNYSFLASTIKIADYIEFAKKNNLQVLSLVDAKNE